MTPIINEIIEVTPSSPSGTPSPVTQNVEYINDSSRAQLLSGIEINQNVPPTISTDFVDPTQYHYQYFKLPLNYLRADTVAPDLTGIQACVNVSQPSDSVAINYVLLASGIQPTLTSGGIVISSGIRNDWQLLASGTTHGIHAIGSQVWADIYFGQNIRFICPKWRRATQLAEATFSVGLQMTGVDGWNFSQPNPYPYGAAYGTDNVTPLYPASSFMFRLLTYSADAGTDWMGNAYRSAVINQVASNVQIEGETDLNKYWLSKPNPSKFAVEALYFDIRDGLGNAQTIDRLLLDPVTQGPVFHVYYSNEGDTGIDSTDWDAKMWTPVPQTYRLTKREVYALPFPITANFIKIEFTRLQAQYYSPGTYSQPVLYRKFPIWVYNYFNVNPVNTDVASTINVVYDTLQLAFDYYLDDLRAGPLSPNQINPDPLQSLPSTTIKNQITPDTLANINTSLAPYTLPIGANITGKSVLSQFMRSSVNLYNYPIESLQVPTAVNTTIVSVPDREKILQQEQQPALYFFINSRHFYQMTQANFEYNRGYFVGLRMVAFLRDDYSVPFDQAFYVESAGDGANAYLNDFTLSGNSWQVIDTTQF